MCLVVIFRFYTSQKPGFALHSQDVLLGNRSFLTLRRFAESFLRVDLGQWRRISVVGQQRHISEEARRANYLQSISRQSLLLLWVPLRQSQRFLLFF